MEHMHPRAPSEDQVEQISQRQTRRLHEDQRQHVEPPRLTAGGKNERKQYGRDHSVDAGDDGR